MAKRTTGTDPGTGIAKMMAQVLSDAVVSVRAGLLPAELAEKWRHNESFMETAEAEMAPLFRQVFANYIADPNLPPHIRAMMDEGADPGHQTGFFIQILAFIGM